MQYLTKSGWYRKGVFCLLLLMSLTTLTSLASKPKRTMHYFPVNGEIVCINGNNRYTRALYGGHSLFRLETSDRPVFATFKKKDSKNIRLFVRCCGHTIQLDSTSFCEARYVGGKRTYTIKDTRLPQDCEIRICAMALFEEDGALWRFDTKGLPADATFEARICNIASTKFARNGDLGTDSRDKFEPSKDEAELQVTTWNAKGESFLVLHDDNRLSVPDTNTGTSLYVKTEQARKELTSLVNIDTPDPIFNTLGATLLHAADGLWDGESWMHGCIGWRTPLAGWRGAYCGDALGFFDRSLKHFRAYANSMVTDVPATKPHPSQDPDKGMSRARKEWGTQMYSNGYICRLPNRKDIMHHYDMNLNYVDALLWHFQYDANPDILREFWPVLKLHLEWEKRNFDPDGDHLYDAYCCIWASDALYYNGGAVTHSSAYNYRGNILAARIAEIIGEDPAPYRNEAFAILNAMNSRLWMRDKGVWAEFQDMMGHKRLHKSAALWSVYTPVDCDACTPQQAYRATMYVDRDIPHIPIEYDMDTLALSVLCKDNPHLNGQMEALGKEQFYTLSTTDWHPYAWSTNNVAHEEVANMALAYLQAGRTESGFRLLKGDILDEMFLGQSPGNIGQISYYDKVLKEAYRDFGDNVGVLCRAVINGLFGIIPNALYGECIIKPAFPSEWNHASVKTPFLTYSFHREGEMDIYEIEQHFPQPLNMVIRANAGGGAYLEVKGNSYEKQTITIDRRLLPKASEHPAIASERQNAESASYMSGMGLDDIQPNNRNKRIYVKLDDIYNSNADDIFKNRYLSPRSPFTTLEIPVQGIGQWCHPEILPTIEDDGLRSVISEDNIYDTGIGIRFRVAKEGKNIAYTSLWDNYPDKIDIPVRDKDHYTCAYLMLAGSTNNMQSRIDNGIVVAHYKDNSADTLHLENPINWCPIDEEYIYDDAAFWSASQHPYRFHLGSGKVSRHLLEDLTGTSGENNDEFHGDVGFSNDRSIPDGAGVILKMNLNRSKIIKKLTLETLSNDVVIGVMGITLEK